MPYQSSMKFEDMFVCDPTAKHMGFKSWDGTPPRNHAWFSNAKHPGMYEMPADSR
ncbi:hypothetical protein J3459_018366 [Metarhizium acridum]|nr:hypothetical protein J3459_018366 [Metarhizium acridum]